MAHEQQAPPKVCPVCARSFAWRAKWARSWDQVRYCSDACRRGGIGDLDRRIEAAILALVEARGRGASICPSEAARAIEAEAWKPLMPRIHNAARRLSRAGRLRILAGGKPIEPDAMRGPVRLTLA